VGEEVVDQEVVGGGVEVVGELGEGDEKTISKEGPGEREREVFWGRATTRGVAAIREAVGEGVAGEEEEEVGVEE
jgi:hypothetical protein